MRIGVVTGGGDAPGLNAAIRGVVLSALHRGFEVVGVRQGFAGLLDSSDLAPLGRAEVRGIAHLGGTILGTTSRRNPFRWALTDVAGRTTEADRSGEVLARVRQLKIDALIVIGGDGTLAIARDLFRQGLPLVGIPKTIDNDLNGTAATIGFDTAVAIATEAIDRLHSTAESHERVLVVEVMGRYAGWIALHAGIAGGADVILIPEIPFAMAPVCDKILRREREGRRFSIVVVAEGAARKGGSRVLREVAGPGGVDRLGGVVEQVAAEVARATGKETRTLTLGHLQRGGSPTTFDRLLGLRFGVAAVRAVEAAQFGRLVAYAGAGVTLVPLDDALTTPKLVPLDGDTIRTARDLGINLGD